MEYTTNAPKGAALLDERYPGWRDRIDRKRFNVRSNRDCAAAQIAGEGYYWDGLKKLFPNASLVPDFSGRTHALHADARVYGFTIDVALDESDDDNMWEVLQAEWEYLIDN